MMAGLYPMHNASATGVRLTDIQLPLTVPAKETQSCL